ncbi:MAG: HEAT repeat domain-containing protein [Fimbriimonadaceae bacterium]|nr:HEAT repeat domain-containing protein [Fimbriimonadaceae bacterium]
MYGLLQRQVMDYKSLLSEFCTSNVDGDRVRTLNSLICLGKKARSHMLFRRFNQESEDIQLSIIFSMRIIANRKCCLILENLLTEQWLTVPVRAAVTEVVGDLGLSQTKPLLRSQLESRYPEIRFWSCQSLGMVGSRDDLAILEEMLSDHEIGWSELTVAQAAIKALEMISHID